MRIDRTFGWPKNLPGARATAVGTYLEFTHWTVVVTVRGDDDVDVFNDALKGLEQIFLLEL